ncbi:methyltransferase domain-containing protein [bacterium]|nr:methyltransferase domain-containing protein [bacterium]
MMGPVRNVDDLMAVGHGYRPAMVLFAGLKLGVFRGLAAGGCDASALARRIGADSGKLSVLLDALAALGLVGKRGRIYRNAQVARELLLPGSRSMESLLLHHLDGWGEWGRLPSTIRAGRKPRGGAQATWDENFIRGMEENARDRAAAAAARIPLRPGDRVLDLGGGPGTYAVAWADACPGAEITIFDTPATLRVTRKILRGKGAYGRVSLAEGDFLKDPLGGPYDFVWISQILHAYPGPDCVRLLRRARSALVQGGRVAVQEFLLAEGKTSPPGPVFFSVHMVAVTGGGRAYTAREIAAMMKAAGFRRISSDPPDSRGVGILRGIR